MNKYKRIYSIASQLTIVLLYPAIFHIAAYLGNASLHKNEGLKLFPMACFIMLGIALITSVVMIFLAGRDKSSDNAETEEAKTSSNKTRDIIALSIVAIVSLALRFPMIGTFQRWDAGEYFYTVGTSVKDYAFTLGSFFHQFTIAYHLNYGFSSFIAIPLFISNRNVVLYTLWQIGFSVLAVMALYAVFRKTARMSEVKAALAALLVGAVPVFLGLSVYCTPDYYVALFFIFALYFGAYKKHILEAFMIIMMCFSKEMGALIVFGFYGARIIYRFINPREENGKKKYVSSDFFVAFFTGVIFVLGYILKGANWSEKVEAVTGVDRIRIGFSYPYVSHNIKLFLFANFAWIISTCLLTSILVVVIRYIVSRRKGKTSGTADKKTEKDRVLLVVGLIGSLTFFGSFGVFVEMPLMERYITFFAVALAMVTILMSDIMVEGIKHRWIGTIYSVVIAFLIVLLTIESFITIDPFTRHFFKQVSIGYHTMSYEYIVMNYFGDGLVTNYQYAWLDKAFDKTLEDIGYDGTEVVYFPSAEQGPETGVHFEGNSGYTFIAWFPEKGHREICDPYVKGSEGLKIESIWEYEEGSADQGYIKDEYLYEDRMTDRATLCFIPYFEEVGITEEPYLKSAGLYYYIGDKEESTAYRGTIYHYPMIIHDNYIDGTTIGDVASGLANGSIDYDPSLKPSDEVEEYYNDYLKRVGITEQEFCDEYLKIDKETYRKCKCVISQMD